MFRSFGKKLLKFCQGYVNYETVNKARYLGLKSCFTAPYTVVA